MVVPNAGRYLRCSLVAGLEVSALAALAALGLLSVLAKFTGMPWHAYGNLFSTVFYSREVLEADPGFHTAAGYALVFLYFVASGLLFAVCFPSNRPGAGPYLVAVFFAIALFMAGDRVWWQEISRFIVIYGIHDHLMWAHVLFGAVLGSVARRRRQWEPLAGATSPPQSLPDVA